MAILYDIIIPTLNAGERMAPLLRALRGQTLPPRQIWVVDSESGDGTAAVARAFEGVRVLEIPRERFDHGGTRDMAIRACSAPFVVLMTQDALPVDAGCMEALLAPMADARVAAVCARQIARPEARAYESEVRAFRYPAGDAAWSREDARDMGMRAYLLSDVCAAYRREAYMAVGGFKHPLATNEDMLIAADFLDAGYRLAYAGGAAVWHSHDYTLAQEYARNRLIGGFLARYGRRFGDSGETGEGVRMVREVSARLLKRGRVIEWIAFGANCAARLLGNRAGKRGERARMRSEGRGEGA